jgi:hypothetical protein
MIPNSGTANRTWVVIRLNKEKEVQHIVFSYHGFPKDDFMR